MLRIKYLPWAMLTILFLLLIIAACGENNGIANYDTEKTPEFTFNQGAAPNDCPIGPHYNLDIIGVPEDETADMTDNSGNQIFVKLVGNTKINLAEGDFAVLDANGTDGTAAFQLPNPDPGNTGITGYSIFARALGEQGGSGKMTCGGDEYSSIHLSLERTSGKSKFTNNCRELLYIYTDINGDGSLKRVPLFDDELQGYFWDNDNNGLRSVELRFYEVPTNVP